MIFLDTEYRDTREQQLTPLCACIARATGTFLYDCRNQKGINELRKALLGGEAIGCYSAAAESRFLLSIGVDVRKLEFVDLYVMWRLVSSIDRVLTTRQGLTDALDYYHITYQADKALNRDIILSKSVFTEDEFNGILQYCKEDVLSLVPLCSRLMEDIDRYYSTGVGMERILYLSKYSAYTGIIEAEGIPINTQLMDKIRRLEPTFERHFRYCTNQLFPFYLHGKRKYNRFVRYIGMRGYTDWPTTEKNRLSLKNEDFKNSGDPVLNRVAEYDRLISHIRWFRPDATDTAPVYIGKDGRLRVGLHSYGTRTGRNAPAAKRYIFAMSSWLRCLVRPPQGYVIIAADFSQQEFYIGAAITRDPVMLESYNSGDVYLHFGKLIGLIPEDGDKKSHGLERQLCKSTVLGLQYGMGLTKLHKKLCIDTGKCIEFSFANNMYLMHHETYSQYWQYMYQTIDEAIENRLPLILSDGWAIRTDPEQKNSLKNWPIQATGQSILRSAVIRLIDANINLISTLHDSIYVICKEAECESVKETMLSVMDRAVKDDLGEEHTIRIDTKIVSRDDVWIEEKGMESFKKFKPFLFKEG